MSIKKVLESRLIELSNKIEDKEFELECLKQDQKEVLEQLESLEE